MVDSHDDTQATFVPNDKWWGTKPLLDKIQFKAMDASASINAFQNGEIDVADVTSADRLKVAQGMDDTSIRVNYAMTSAVVTLNAKPSRSPTWPCARRSRSRSTAASSPRSSSRA